MRKLLRYSCFMALLFSAMGSRAQADDLTLFTQDMLSMADDFASPAAEGAAYLSSAGWFNSARSLELWQLDLSIQGNVLFIPEEKRSVTSGNFDLIQVRGGGPVVVPTAFGGNTDVVYEGDLFGTPFSFNALDGINTRVLAHPFLQVAVGLPFGTELIGRVLPATEIDNVRFSTFGVGLKHNFNQHFLNPQPNDFQFAALVAYSRYDVNYKYNPIVIEHDIPGWSSQSSMENIDVDGDFFLVQLIGSKRLGSSAWDAVAAVGLTNYDFSYVLGGQGELVPVVNTELESLSNNIIEFKGDLGITYEAGNFLFSSMFSQGKFSNLNVGIHYRL